MKWSIKKIISQLSAFVEVYKINLQWFNVFDYIIDYISMNMRVTDLWKSVFTVSLMMHELKIVLTESILKLI